MKVGSAAVWTLPCFISLTAELVVANEKLRYRRTKNGIRLAGLTLSNSLEGLSIWNLRAQGVSETMNRKT